jgi:cytochrome b6-f complex iron-sulfur subunit
MRWLANAILRVYPPRWRERYEAELADVIARRRLRARDLADLLGGALDARLNPRLASAKTLQLAVASRPGVVPTPAPLPHRPLPAYGPVPAGAPGLVSRRSFLRRMLSVGIGIVTLEFLGGTLAFLWPPPAEGVGVEHRVGTVRDIIGTSPTWATGRPWEFRPARAFLVNVEAATAMASGSPREVATPVAGGILALWRKCPHLGCMIPMACETRSRFQCLCHQSTYNIIGEKLQLGPAPRGMDRFPVRIDEAGIVIVDTREIIKGPPTGTVTFHDPYPPNEGCG